MKKNLIILDAWFDSDHRKILINFIQNEYLKDASKTDEAERLADGMMVALWRSAAGCIGDNKDQIPYLWVPLTKQDERLLTNLGLIDSFNGDIVLIFRGHFWSLSDG